MSRFPALLYTRCMPAFQNRTYAAFLFDMDGTMLDSSAVAERIWRAWAKRHGVDPTSLLAAAQGVRSEDTIRRFGPAGIDVTEESAWVLREELSDVESVVPIAGINALVESLDPSTWAVVTSAPRVLAERRLRAVGLPIPKTLVPAEVVTQGKPSPEGYLKAAAMLRAPISECLVFEDSPAGVAAAKAAGAHVAIVGNLVAAGEGMFSILDYR